MKKRMFKGIAGFLAATMVTSGVFYAPITTYAAGKSVTVKTQKELNAALADETVTKVNIKNTGGKKLTIKSGKFAGKTLVVADKKANIVNKGQFKSIAVKDAKAFTEKADNNTIKVTDTTGIKIVVSVTSEGAKITSSAEGKVTVVVNGDVKSMKITEPGEYTIKGVSEDAVKVTVTANAEGATIKTEVPVTITSKADVEITINAGAEGSSVRATGDAQISVENKSEGTVQVTDAAGQSVSVEENQSALGATVTDSSDTNSTIGANNGYNGGGIYGGSIPTQNTEQKVYKSIEKAVEEVNGGSAYDDGYDFSAYYRWSEHLVIAQYETWATAKSIEDGRWKLINDMDRFFGILNKNGIDRITFDNTVYTWNAELGNSGCNYVNGETLLVDAILDGFVLREGIEVTEVNLVINGINITYGIISRLCMVLDGVVSTSILDANEKEIEEKLLEYKDYWFGAEYSAEYSFPGSTIIATYPSLSSAQQLEDGKEKFVNDMYCFYGILHMHGINEITFDENVYSWNTELENFGSKFANGETQLVEALIEKLGSDETQVTMAVDGINIAYKIAVAAE